ncbi:recombination mediator RecR [Geopsychrobacter electrodiphilus]|uniref:recombination mediator RecR n=1 Tax=Geopsychrobacter electrodiphilus TaxID=225196 RepID=UPI00037203B7|nr:recombination mediator RecR [Geopsychrobacter electrodiphilus]
MLGSLPSFARLVAELGKLPGIGGKTATRLAFHLLRKSQEDVQALATAMVEMKRNLSFCVRCFNIAEGELCRICTDAGRDESCLCVVQEPQDLIAIERSHGFRGQYHVLHGALSPLDGVGPEDLKLPQLLERLRGDKIHEVLVATSFTVEGEATALYLARILKDTGIKMTRLAHGIPLGSDLEYIDSATVHQAIDSRREF